MKKRKARQEAAVVFETKPLAGDNAVVADTLLLQLLEATRQTALVASLLASRGLTQRKQQRVGSTTTAYRKGFETKSAPFFYGYLAAQRAPVRFWCEANSTWRSRAPLKDCFEWSQAPNQPPLGVVKTGSAPRLEIVARPVDGRRDLSEGYGGAASIVLAAPLDKLLPTGTSIDDNKHFLAIALGPGARRGTIDAIATYPLTSMEDALSLMNTFRTAVAQPSSTCATMGWDNWWSFRRALLSGGPLHSLKGSPVVAVIDVLLGISGIDLFAVNIGHRLALMMAAAATCTGGHVFFVPIECTNHTRRDNSFAIAPGNASFQPHTTLLQGTDLTLIATGVTPTRLLNSVRFDKECIALESVLLRSRGRHVEFLHAESRLDALQFMRGNARHGWSDVHDEFVRSFADHPLQP